MSYQPRSLPLIWKTDPTAMPTPAIVEITSPAEGISASIYTLPGMVLGFMDRLNCPEARLESVIR